MAPGGLHRIRFRKRDLIKSPLRDPKRVTTKVYYGGTLIIRVWFCGFYRGMIILKEYVVCNWSGFYMTRWQDYDSSLAQKADVLHP